jgi:hypothetical protein
MYLVLFFFFPWIEDVSPRTYTIIFKNSYWFFKGFEVVTYSLFYIGSLMCYPKGNSVWDQGFLSGNPNGILTTFTGLGR